ncbi:hypothetical protein G3554_23580 [Micromonospora sp. PPF5-17]|uniref:Uncharacterized protein n=1 Tax=Micromonospora solifontis TaxID=2487138 RepID=A0ABX9WA45_9ACTN|nr:MULTISPECIES: hypothetical protein [Micromonospora]NES39103.1 hypothetical protein [Micromonospora solifontis]NES58849.1 hypothetical protein [Micromonospora sp. PPF5-6]RNL91112.1 hypothetical protein EFE23_23675 [Micromonospora solifontis]
MRIFGSPAGQLLLQLPTLMVLVTGLVLALVHRRLPRTGRGLLLGGVALLLLALLLNVAWVLTITHAYRTWNGTEALRFGMAVGALQLLLHPAGLALIIAAALTGRRVPSPDAPPYPTGWPAPAGAPHPPPAAVIPPQPTERP